MSAAGCFQGAREREEREADETYKNQHGYIVEQAVENGEKLCMDTTLKMQPGHCHWRNG